MKKIIINISVLILVLAFNACKYNYDNDLVRPDGLGGSYLTPLGCLVNGPWSVSNISDSFNVALFYNDTEISSKGMPYSDFQKDFVFELHKNGTLTYWLKSENGLTFHKLDSREVRVDIKQSSKDDDLKKVYTDGYWKVNFKDSSFFIHFGKKDIPELNYKFSNLGNGHGNFSETVFFDSVYHGKQVKIKQINTIHYETLYPRF